MKHTGWLVNEFTFNIIFDQNNFECGCTSCLKSDFYSGNFKIAFIRINDNCSGSFNVQSGWIGTGSFDTQILKHSQTSLKQSYFIKFTIQMKWNQISSRIALFN